MKKKYKLNDNKLIYKWIFHNSSAHNKGRI